MAESSEGFSVEVVGRNGLRYREDGREMLIFSEFLVSEQPKIFTKVQWVRGWDAPDDAEAVTPDDQKRILANISQALDFLGWRLLVE
jgi:hypothetical protein